MYAKSRREFADLYGFCPRTFTNRLRAAGIDLASRKLISPVKQIEIFAYFGVPFTQERQWQRNQVPLIELYSGAMGDAFEVPKL